MLEKLGDRFHSDFSSFLIGEMKFSRRNTAKSYTGQPLLRRQLQTGAIAGRQVLPVTPGYTTVNDRADRVKHIAGRKIISPCQLCFPVWFRMSLPLHDPIAFVTKFKTCGGVNCIVNAAVTGTETAKKCIVVGVYDGIHSQPGNVPLPKSQPGILGCHWENISIHNASFFPLGRQKRILYLQKFRI